MPLGKNLARPISGGGGHLAGKSLNEQRRKKSKKIKKEGKVQKLEWCFIEEERLMA